MADLSGMDERNTSVTPGIMVGGAIEYDFKSPLVVMWGALLTLLYHCHRGCMSCPSQHKTMIQSFIKKPVHTWHVSMDCLVQVAVLPWPVRSPNLPQSKVWNFLVHSNPICRVSLSCCNSCELMLCRRGYNSFMILFHTELLLVSRPEGVSHPTDMEPAVCSLPVSDLLAFPPLHLGA